MAKKRSKAPGGDAEFSGGGGGIPNLTVSVNFIGTGGASKVEQPGKRGVTIIIPTKAVVKLLLSGGLHLGAEDTTIDVPIGTGDRVKVIWE